MTPVTAESLLRHELVGLPVSVADATNPDLLGIEGEVVAETTKTLGIERTESSPEDRTAAAADGDRLVQVPKAGTTFAFDLPSGEVVRVDGDRLVARPARRTENTGESKWR